MKKQTLFEQLRAYALGKGDKEASQHVEDFFASRANEKDFRSGESEVLKHEESIKKRSWSNIQEKIHTPSSRSYFSWKIAASLLFLLASTSLIISFWPSEPTLVWREHTTGVGERMEIVLPDSSMVWLNANSRLRYPEKFSGGTRPLMLEGEAFFQVVPNLDKPFIVTTAQVHTQVLGTSFNVNAYDDEHPIVTVAEGKVKVYSGTQFIHLVRNQQVTYYEEGRLRSLAVDATTYFSWSGNLISMNDMTALELTNALSNWYHVEFIFDAPLVKECRVNGKIKIDSLDNILQSLAFLLQVKFEKLPGNKIRIAGEGCHSTN